MIHPTIVVGLGGQGSAIALGVKQRLEYFARSRENSEAELDVVNRMVRVLSLDVDHVAHLHGQFDASSKVRMTPAAPDRLIQNRTGILAEWWPDHILAPGAFDAGCGGMRAKGRLAYYLSGFQMADKIAGTVTALRAEAASLGIGIEAGGAIQVYIYVVGSLAGGTGSGSLLTLSMDLRSRLDDNVRIIGAIPLASIMFKGPGNFMRDNVYANTFAGLRELEWWLTPPSRRLEQTTPFFVDSRGHRVVGDGTEGSSGLPFDFCYLFTDESRAGEPLPTFAAYTELIADCIAMDINAPAAEAQTSLNNNIYAQTLQKVAPPGADACKPIVFASAGTASILFSVRHTSAYLGDQLLLRVLDSLVLPEQHIPDDARRWLIEQRILADANHPNPIHERLMSQYRHPDTGEITALQSTKLRLEGIERKQWSTAIARQKSTYDDQWLVRLSVLAALHAPEIIQDVAKSLVATLEATLDRPEGDGFSINLGWLRAISGLLKNRLGDVDIELDAQSGDPNTVAARLSDTLGLYQRELEHLTKGGKGIARFRGGDAEAVGQFERRWWAPYTSRSRDRQLLIEERAVLRALISHVDRYLAAFEQAYIEVRRVRYEREQSQGDYFSDSAGPMAKEDRVLGSAELVDAVFSREFEQALDPSSGTVATIARNIVNHELPLRAWLFRTSRRNEDLELQDLRNSVTTSFARSHDIAARQFRPLIEDMSLWDAMEEEFFVRIRTGKTDAILDGLGGARATQDQLQAMLESYLIQRVRRCLDAALPQWKLDTVRLDHYGNDFLIGHTGLAIYSPEPFKRPDARDGMRQMGQRIEALLGGNVSSDTNGQSSHHFVVSMREWGAPLFMLDEGERREMTTSERNWQRVFGHTYIDERYKEILPTTFELSELNDLWRKKREAEVIRDATERVEQQREAAVFALGVVLNYIRKLPGTASLNGTAPYEFTAQRSRSNYQPMGAGVDNVLKFLRSNPHVANGLWEMIQNERQSMSHADRSEMFDAALNWIDHEQGAVGFDPVARPILDQMHVAVEALRRQEGL